MDNADMARIIQTLLQISDGVVPKKCCRSKQLIAELKNQYNFQNQKMFVVCWYKMLQQLGTIGSKG